MRSTATATAVRAAALLALAAALLGGCSSARPVGRSGRGGSSGAGTKPSAAEPSVVVAPPDWKPCTASTGPSGFQCATLSVPLDPARPGGATIGLALDRAPATGKAIGSLLVNPGGPGVSGVDALPQIVSELGPALRSRFNVIGFDPPGVGRSDPVVCLGRAGLERYFDADPAPTTAAGFEHLVSVDRRFAEGCEARSGKILPYVSTADAARDMDLIRRALGEPKLTYLGFSYGTLLGATYAGLFPTKVRAMVLDGALDPALPAVRLLDQQSESLEGQFEAFASSCAGEASCPWRPQGSPTAAFESLMSSVRAKPVPVAGTGQSVGPAELLYGAAAALYDPRAWPTLGEALAGLQRGDGRLILELFDSYTGRRANGSYSNLFEANAAVNCLDDPAPPLSEIEADAPAAQAAAPIFGLPNLYSEVGCAVWPVPATGHPGPITAPGSPPIVVVGSTGDPITPYRWAEALAGQLSHGVLLTRVGDGHTAYAYSSCIRRAVDRYLLNLTVPAPGTRCPSG